jgi:molybdopterin-guanine dinucleotide biosynthesis protein A
MGRDKALVSLAGVPLAAVAARALRQAGAIAVTMVGGDLPALGRHGLPGIPDLYPGEGPLGGVLTALQWAPVELVVVLSCDLATIGATEVEALVRGLQADAGADVAAPLVQGRPQYLTAAYRRAVHGALQERFDDGERAMRRAVARSGLRIAALAGLDPRHLADIDTPEALGAAAQCACHHGDEQ